MTFPTYLLLGRHRIQVKLSDTELETDDGPAYAFWDRDARVIWISSKQSPLDQGSCLLHELLHAISDFNGLDLTETQIHVLEENLVAVVHRTPEVVPALLGAIRTESGKLYTLGPPPYLVMRELMDRLSAYDWGCPQAEDLPRDMRLPRDGESLED